MLIKIIYCQCLPNQQEVIEHCQLSVFSGIVRKGQCQVNILWPSLLSRLSGNAQNPLLYFKELIPRKCEGVDRAERTRLFLLTPRPKLNSPWQNQK